jgi:hypothetical protein
VRSRRFLFLLLLFVSVDFALPYEPTARGWYEIEDEEESVHPEGRRLERPRPTGQPATTAAPTASRPRPSAVSDPRARRRQIAPVTRLARADTSSPPTSPEAH